MIEFSVCTILKKLALLVIIKVDNIGFELCPDVVNWQILIHSGHSSPKRLLQLIDTYSQKDFFPTKLNVFGMDPDFRLVALCFCVVSTLHLAHHY